ncbi:MAG TPA: 30S ribosomal protein S12 methylthiotransferase RimO [Actinomycetota bacterium]|nr:30S ribosomal protein S12 methylthiotransferase RimO [Actinomycetota bacterium]
MSRVSIVTLGCPKNSIDSEGLGGLLSAGGHEVSEEVAGADVVVVNTCGFIDAARRETIEEVLDLAELKQAGKLEGLILTGCLVARTADDLAESLPEVDAFVDFAAYPRIASIVASVADGSLAERIHGEPGTRFDPAWWDATIAASPRLRFGRAPWAYVKIAEGCDRGCTFCAIPLMRGKFRSRAPETITAEIEGLVAQGVTEISLVSQDSVQWGRDIGAGDLTSLLTKIEKIDGLRRVRLMYLHPQGVTGGLIEKMASSEVIVNYFDLSLQHVAPEILRAMGRWGGRDRFEKMIDHIRSLDPLAGLRATFIMGFPGETDAHADQVADFVSDAGLDWIGTFTYSRELGTRSNELDDHIEPTTARERTERVALVADRAMDQRAAALRGHVFETLVERFDLEDGRWHGRSQREAPEVDGDITIATDIDLAVGDYVPVEITGNDGADLLGRTI